MKSTASLQHVVPTANTYLSKEQLLLNRKFAHIEDTFHKRRGLDAIASSEIIFTMTAAVAPLPIPLQIPDSTSEARKRRREILSSQRNAVSALDASKPLPVVKAPEAKRRKTDTAKPKTAKKPQMKYDPDVPMTKEEAAAWRREQRRKRNRESAAASRQRQRDRITELEGEVEDWKIKFDAMMDKIKKLEEVSGKKPEDYWRPEQSLVMVESVSKFVSPPSSPGHSPFSSPVASPVASSSFVIPTVKVTPSAGFENKVMVGAQEHSDNLISRQATSRIIHP